MSQPITLVLGASENAERYSNKAIRMLRKFGHEVVAVGVHAGKVEDVDILTQIPEGLKPDTVTVYLNPQIQKTYYDSIQALKPRRVIFNPGTENADFEQALEAKGIAPVEACTLVLLSTHQF
jgi:predicted CoA-binding protein